MIKFFRRIRQKLLLEGKVGKYVTYAIGEILLVVIGILIALSLNNWNQEKQEKEIVDGYIDKIGNELVSDIENINQLIDKRKLALNYTYTILGYFKNNKIEDSKLFEEAYFSIFVESRFHPNKNMYESLKASGYMKNLENSKMEQQFSQYYQMVDNLLFVENKFNNITGPVEISLAEKGFYDEYAEMFRWNNNDTIIFSIQSIKQFPEFQATFVKSRMFLEELIDEYRGVLNKAKETLDLIENEG